MTGDEYLWDKSGAPDEDVRELERALAPRGFRADEAPPPAWNDESAPTASPPAWVHGMRDDAASAFAPSRARKRVEFGVAATVLALIGLGVREFLRGDEGERAGSRAVNFQLVTTTGAPSLNGRPVDVSAASAPGSASKSRSGAVALRPGEVLVCDEGSTAELRVGDIGSVRLGPGSRVRVEPRVASTDEPDAEAPGAGEYRLFLERGTLAASIFAAPRVFQVGTPAGIAVDLGCAYEATVDDHGNTRLAVSSGVVSFETQGRRVVVPAGAETEARPGAAPGTPVWQDSDATWRAALRRLDGAADFAPADLELVLARAKPRDSLTLWHLLAHPTRELRERVFDRLAGLAPPPAGVTRAGCVEGAPGAGAAMHERWKQTLDWYW